MSNSTLPIRLLVGDELGQLKAIQAPDQHHMDSLALVSRWGTPDKSMHIISLVSTTLPTTNDNHRSVVIIGRKNGTIEAVDTSTGTSIWKTSTLDEDNNDRGGDNSGSSVAQKQRSDSNNEQHAIQSIHIINKTTTTSDNNSDDDNSRCILSCSKGGIARLHSITGRRIAKWNIPSDVYCTAYDESSNRLAVACKGTELRVYSIQSSNNNNSNNGDNDNDTTTATKKKKSTNNTNTNKDTTTNITMDLIYSAKGGKPNKVGLVDKPWNTAVTFLPGSKGTKIITGTGYHKLRMYDTTIGKRPQLDIQCSTTRVTALAAESSGSRCWVADGEGAVQVFDFKVKKFVGTIKGIAGSVKCLCVDDELKWIASVGLDRFLRVHSVESRQCVGKVYLKTQLTSVVFSSSNGNSGGGGGDGKKRKGDGDDDVQNQKQQSKKKK